MVGGHAWQGGMCGRGKGMHGKGEGVHDGGMCDGDMHGGGHAWQGAYMACTPPEKYYEIWSMNGQYASYWNAFLFVVNVMVFIICISIFMQIHDQNFGGCNRLLSHMTNG